MPMTDQQAIELGQAMFEDPTPTRRPVSPGMERMLFQPLYVLDHGFVRVVDYMGNDASIVQAARVSYGKGTKSVSEDEGLIRYLMRHRHSTPFEMASVKLHVKLPIFVARQWIRHRTASVNEYSARYSVMDREFYVPKAEHMAVQSSSNKQGRGEALDAEKAAAVMLLLRGASDHAFDVYDTLIDEEEGVNLSRELARIGLTLNTYTQWYWKVDLHNLLHFLSLRADAHAQHEIRVYAEAILSIVKGWVPYTYRAFMDYRLNSVTISAPMIDALRRFRQGEHMDQQGSGLSKREWEEMLALAVRLGD